MTRDFKSQIFCRETNLSKREIDTSDPIWIERIDAFFQKTSLLPPDGDPTEYAAAFEAVYPQPRHRRQYVDDAISKGTPSFGHKVLGSLIAAGKVDCLFTTNFDPLVEDAALAANALLAVEAQSRPTVAAIDSADRAMRCLEEADWPLIAKLHGDYQSIAIKNTGSELEQQDARMRHVLVETAKRFGMLFVGYSGRDASIMEAMNEALTAPSPFPNGLYWVTSSASRLLPAVTEFLSRAQAAGIDTAVIECSTFDELATAVVKVIDMPQQLYDRIMEGRPTPRLLPVQLPTAEAKAFPVLRYSALLVETMPRAARRMRLEHAASTSTVREMLKKQKCQATVSAVGRELAVFGPDQEVLRALSALGASLAGTIELDPVADSWARGLLYDSLVRSLTRQRPLIPRYSRGGHSIVVATPREGDSPERARWQQEILSRLRSAYDSNLTGLVPKLGFKFQEGVQLKLDFIDGRWWCGFEPYTFVELPRREAPTEHLVSDSTPFQRQDFTSGRAERGGDPAGDWRRERWAQRYNKNWAEIIGAWADLLTESGDNRRRAFKLEEGAGLDAIFTVSPVTGYSRPGHHHAYFDRSR